MQYRFPSPPFLSSDCRLSVDACLTPAAICGPWFTDSYGTRRLGMYSPGAVWQRLMIVPVLGIRPVGMSMIFFKVLVFMNMRLTNDSCMFVNVMIIVVIVQMRMNLLLV